MLQGEAAELCASDLERLLLNSRCRQLGLVGCGDLVPIFCILFVVEVLAPLDQIVNLIIELAVMHVYQILVVERIVVELFELLGDLVVDLDVGCLLTGLLLHELSVLGVAVQLTQPANLPQALLTISQCLALPRIEVERPLLLVRVNFNLVIWRKILVVDRPPAIVLDALVPTFMIILLGLVILDVDGLLLLFLLELDVVARSECIDVTHGAVHKDLVVDEWRKLEAAETEPNVALRCRVEQVRLTTINTLQQLIWVTLVLEVDEVLVVFVNAHVCVATPGFLNFLRSNDVLGLQLHSLLALYITSPRPLYLNSGNMIHGEAVILEQSSRQRHLVRCLNDCRAVVSQTLVLIQVRHVELGREELLAQALQR